MSNDYALEKQTIWSIENMKNKEQSMIVDIFVKCFSLQPSLFVF